MEIFSVHQLWPSFAVGGSMIRKIFQYIELWNTVPWLLHNFISVSYGLQTVKKFIEPVWLVYARTLLSKIMTTTKSWTWRRNVDDGINIESYLGTETFLELHQQNDSAMNRRKRTPLELSILKESIFLSRYSNFFSWSFLKSNIKS